MFIQVTVYPRQVGKTTVINQLLEQIYMSYLFVSTDGNFTVLEERLTYFIILKEVRREHFNLLGVRIE